MLKDAEQEHPVPTAWRNTLARIVDCFVQGDFTLTEGVSDAAWETSISSWQDGYWDVLVDLFTTNGASDLALNVRVKEDPVGPEAYQFDVHFVYVP